MDNKQYKAGDVFLANVPEVGSLLKNGRNHVGVSLGKYRPCVVLWTCGNQITVLPMTSNTKGDIYKDNIRIKLEKDGLILCKSITTISHRLVKSKIGEVDNVILDKIKTILIDSIR